MQFITIEGLDGSGKSTQLRMLCEYLEKQKIPYRYLHFPRLDRPPFGELISRFLRGELGKIDQVDPYLVALMYAGDRHHAASEIRQWMADGQLVIVDRYVHSNIAFQCAKSTSTVERTALRDWIIEVEYGLNQIPRPAKSLFLDVPFAFTSQNLSSQRTGSDRDYLQGATDIHEADLSFQSRVRDVYHWQATFGDLAIVPCYGIDQRMLPPDTIFQKIIETLNLTV